MIYHDLYHDLPFISAWFTRGYHDAPWFTMIYILNFGIFHISNWKLYQRVQPLAGCDFRHTDFVELTAPLLKSAVLLGFASSPFSWIQERPNTLQVKEHPGRLQALYSWQVWLGAWHDAGPSAVEPNAEPDAVRHRSTPFDVWLSARGGANTSPKGRTFSIAFALDDSSCFNGNLHRLKDFMDSNSATREHIQAYIC